MISNFKTNTSRGFSLIEMMVATAIFTTVSIVAIGAIFTINDANRKAQAIRAVVDNLNLSLESMSRRLMAGTDFACGVGGLPVSVQLIPCVDGAKKIAFLSSERLTLADPTSDLQSGAVVVYELRGQDGCAAGDPRCVTSAECSTPTYSNTLSCRGKIMSSRKINFSTYEQPIITPPEVNIQDLRFYVVANSGEQPRVIISISGEIDLVKENLKTPFNLQTTVSQRKPI